MVLECHTNLVRCRHFGDAPDLSDFRGGAFPRMVHFPKEPSSAVLKAQNTAYLPGFPVVRSPKPDGRSKSVRPTFYSGPSMFLDGRPWTSPAIWTDGLDW